MINRDSRTRLAVLIRSYLSEEITAFQFDDALGEFRKSDDPAVELVTDQLWYMYDDCDDHRVVLTKPDWNYIQRLLLLLESDAIVHVDRRWEWSARNLISLVFFSCCLLLIYSNGWGHELLIYFIPFGLTSIAIAHAEPEPKVGVYKEIVFPFKSFKDLQTAFKATSFRKVKYPQGLATREIRSGALSQFYKFHSYVVWLIFAPIPLLFQSLPSRHADYEVTV